MKELIFALSLICASASAQIDSTATELGEIVIENDVKAFTNKNGNLKLDVANSIYKSIPNVLDLLARLPKLQISPDRESIGLVGKGNPLIYIDHTRAAINDLNALSVDDIKSIEIINNPSSKYEADGKAVILITRKWRKSNGFQYNFSHVASLKKAFNNYASACANLKINTTEIRCNFNLNHLKPWESNANNYEIPMADIASNYNVAGFTKRKQYIFGAGVFQQLHTNDYISLGMNGKRQADNFRFSTRTFNSDNGEENNIETVGNNLGDKTLLNSVLNYNNKLPHDANFFAGLQYSKFAQESNITSFNNYNQTQFNPFRSSEQDFTIDTFSARVDFDKKCSKFAWESGLSFYVTVAKTGLQMANFETAENTRTRYRLEEKNASAYTQMSGIIKKVSWSLGLRLENTTLVGQYITDANPAVDKSYANVFPKMQLDFPVDSTKTITFNYAKSISRPDYSATSNNITYINPYFLFSGNTNLNPSISNEVSANFQYRDKSINASFYRTKDHVNYSFLYDDAQHLLTYRLENLDSETGYSIELTLPFSTKFWSVINVCSANINKIEDAGALSNAVRPFLYFYSNHMFKLEKKWIIAATGRGSTKRYQGILENNAFFTFDMAVSKTYKNWMCTLSANDLFKGMNFKEKFNIRGVSTVGKYYTDTREFSIALQYSFGKVKESTFEENAVSGEVGRMK